MGVLGMEGALSFRIGRVPKEFLLGFEVPAETALALPAGAAVIAALWILLRRADPAERRGAATAAAIGAATIGFAALASALATDYFNSRNVLSAWLPLAVPLGAGIAARRAGRLGPAAAAVLVAVCAVATIGVPLERTYQRDDWRSAVRAIGPATGPRAVVAPRLGPESLRPYMPRLRLLRGGSAAIVEVAVVALPIRAVDEHRPVAPPAPVDRPQLRGFTIVETRRAATYSLVRYRAPRPVPTPRANLAGVALDYRAAKVLVEP